jgi:hypothetical protein
METKGPVFCSGSGVDTSASLLLNGEPKESDMPNEIIIVESPAYETRTEYGTRVSLGEATPADEYGSFEMLTTKLVNVPKPEVDEQREK